MGHWAMGMGHGGGSAVRQPPSWRFPSMGDCRTRKGLGVGPAWSTCRHGTWGMERIVLERAPA
jgi:hypothetical protein